MVEIFQGRGEPLGSRLRGVWEREHDPFLNTLRWGLHLRLLLVSAALCAGFFLRSVIWGGSLDLGLGALACLAAWALLRCYPGLNRWVLRANLIFFCALALHALEQREALPFPSALLALMLMPVFATLLDGVGAGTAVLVMALLSGAWWLLGHRQGPAADTLSVAFCLLSALGFYLCSVTHTWIFVRLVGQRRQNTLATQAARAAVERLAATLSDHVLGLTRRLSADLLAHGLDKLDAAQALGTVLRQARQERPGEIPARAVAPGLLLEGLRRKAFLAFLNVARWLAALVTIAILAIHPPEWQLAAGVAVLCAWLYRGSRRDRTWHWRARLFVAGTLAACLADVLISTPGSPASSLIFTPVIIFFAAMLDELWFAAAACAVTLGLVLLCYIVQGPGYPYASMLSSLSLFLPLVITVSAATLPMYRAFLEQLAAEESQLEARLRVYQRLMSTFFHDLANPLMVLQSLSDLTPDLREADDALRALRMADRLDAVVQAARQDLLGAPPMQSRASVGQLGEALYDVFKERLGQKELRWVTGPGAELSLSQGGPVLQESVLGHLLDNTIQGSAPGSRIEFKAWEESGGLHLQLSSASNEGVSIADLPLLKAYLADLGGSLWLRTGLDGGIEIELLLPQV